MWGTTLKEFYKSPSRWAFTLQATILTSMAERRDQALREHAERGVIFFERSPASAALFAATSAHNLDMNEDEVAILHRLHRRLTWAADLTILIDTPAPMRTRERGFLQRAGLRRGIVGPAQSLTAAARTGHDT